MRVLGIDPGIHGGWAVIGKFGSLESSGIWKCGKVGSYKIPRDLSAMLREFLRSDVIVIEEQHSLPGSPSVSLAQQCTGYGYLLGYVHTLASSPVHTVRPNVWVSDLIRAGIGESKAKTGEKITTGKGFRNLIPGIEKIEHDGILDAAGIAWWYWAEKTGVLNTLREEKIKERSKEKLADSWLD